ncbi:MAG TPA: hypothetical protein VHS76_11390 [Steroidobacteraceae bacterium]|jgi:hypothetical protein|nr:hypothetical protein [Steroidobacteraceae bacterium]
MQRSKRILTSVVVSGLLALAALPAASATNDGSAGGSVVAGTWEHRRASFHYSGITSLYSCAGLETNIRALLQHLGARKDLTVRAYGCLGGYNVPGRTAIVDVDFYSLAPSTDANAAHSVQARWTPVTVSANHPNSIGHGDCELIDEMKDILSKNFSLRGLNYRTDCVPREVNSNDFSVKAEILRPLGATEASAAQG